jgi:hypothetical protein
VKPYLKVRVIPPTGGCNKRKAIEAPFPLFSPTFINPPPASKKPEVCAQSSKNKLSPLHPPQHLSPFGKDLPAQSSMRQTTRKILHHFSCIRLSLTFSEGKPYAEKKSRRVVCLMEDCAQTSGKALHTPRRDARAAAPYSVLHHFSCISLCCGSSALCRKEKRSFPRVCLCRAGICRGFYFQQ